MAGMQLASPFCGSFLIRFPAQTVKNPTIMIDLIFKCILALILAASLFIDLAGAATFGNTAIDGPTEEGYSGNLGATRFTSPSDCGTLTRISVYSTNISGSDICLSIYTDNSGYPGSKIVQGCGGSSSSSWRNISMSTNLSPNTVYWLVFGDEDGGYTYKYRAGAANQFVKVTGNYYPTHPATFPAGGTYYAREYSIYATYTPLDLCPGGVVTTTADTGTGSLRECINKANANPGTTITFNIAAAANQTSGGDSWWRISPGSALPAITAANTTIDGAGQTANRGNTNTRGPEIEIHGANAPIGTNGITIGNVSNVTVKDLVVNGFRINVNSNGIGINISGSSAKIYGCYIGTDARGATAVANQGIGILLNSSATGNDIGGFNAGEGNLIAGNGKTAIYITGNNNRIRGNKIGTDRTGTVKIGNGNHGVEVVGSASGTIIGGSAAGAGNIISGVSTGILLSGTSSSTTVQGNIIGTGVAGTETGLGNDGGIYINSSAAATNNLIGGLNAGEGNLFAFNTYDGINVVDTGSGDRILGNTFRSNQGPGIKVSDTGLVISKNLFLNNNGAGLRINAAGTNAKVYHNTIHGQTGPSGDGILVSATGAVMRNNIITGNSGYGISASVAITESYNLITDASTTPANGSGRSNVAIDPTSLSANPLFGNAASGDFTLQNASPAINRGLNLGADQPDMNGAAAGNFNGYAPDLGYWESSVTTTCPVSTTADSGAGSLRACITHANSNPGTTVSFSIGSTANQSSGGDSWWRISPATALPTITAAGTVIDGTTQTTNIGNSNSLGPEIEIHGSGSPSYSGIAITSANNTIKGMTIGGFSVNPYAGIHISGASATGNTISGNYLGVNATGTAANANYNGIVLATNAHSNTIGGTTPAERNVISGNSNRGISISGTNSHTIKGNYIGVNALGTAAIGNGAGLEISAMIGGTNSIIGGTDVADRNVISGNSPSGGILLSGASVSGNTVAGNYIGLNAAGTAAIANSRGIWISQGVNNIIGGAMAGSRNIISGNAGAGIIINNSAGGNTVYNNYIGTDTAGTAARANSGPGVQLQFGAVNNIIGGTGANQPNVIAFNSGDGVWVDSATTDGNIISGNSIFSNSGLGIDLAPDGVGTGTGANNDKPRPTLTSITPSGGDFIITATVSSGDTIEFFRANNAAAPTVTPDPTGSGEGYLYLGSCVDNGMCSGPHISAIADADGAAGTVRATLLASGVNKGDFVTATATDAVNGTSEFSVNVIAASSNLTIDGDFSDWCKGDGTDICFDDAGGPDDWTNPSRLDITRFGIGSNLSDTLFVLMGFDDTSFTAGNNATACVLIDTTLDDNINAVLCSTLGSGGVQAVELFTCDSSISGGCGSASLAKTYSPANYGFSNSVAGPWNTDSMIEIGIPFEDLPGSGSSVILTTLMSYASSSLLKSPKDSIFGIGGRENYNDRVHYNIGTGTGGQIGAVGQTVISGQVFAEEGVNFIGSGRTVRLLVDGSDRGTNTTDAFGGYFFSLPLSAGSTVLLYLDDATEKATTVTVASSGHLHGVDLYASHLITRHENGGELTNANLATAKGTSTDTDILYSVSGGNLTVSGSGTILYLPAAHGYTPGGNVTTPALKSLGTFKGGSGSIAVNGGPLIIAGGNFTATNADLTLWGNLTISGGSFSHNGGTLVLRDTSLFDIGQARLNHLVINMSAGNRDLTVAGDVALDGNLTIRTISSMLEGTVSVMGHVITETSGGGGTTLIRLVGEAESRLMVNDEGGLGNVPGIEIAKSNDGVVRILDKIRVRGDWRYSSGILIPGNSTVIFGNPNPAGKVISGTHALHHVTFDTSDTGTRTWTIAEGTTLIVEGTLEFNNSFSGVLSLQTGTLAARGDIVVANARNYGGGNARLLIDGSGNQTLTGYTTRTAGSLPNLEINKPSGTLTLEGTLRTLNKNWTYTAGALNAGASQVIFANVEGNGTISGTHTLNDVIFDNRGGNARTWALTAGTELTVAGNLAFDNKNTGNFPLSINTGTIIALGNVTSGTPRTGGSGTLRFAGSADQTFDLTGAESDFDLSNIVVDKDQGQVELLSHLVLNTANQNLVIKRGILDLNGFDLTVTGSGTAFTVQADCTLRLQGNETVTATTLSYQPVSTVRYYGSGSYSKLGAGNNYGGNVSIEGGGSWTLNNPLSIAGNFALSNGALDAAGHTISVGGNWSNSGTYTPTDNTVTLSGTGQQISGDTTFHNLTKTVAAADTLTFEAGSTTTVNGALTLKGTAGQLLTLASSAPGTHWNLNLTEDATNDIAHVHVSWSDASGSHASRIPVNPSFSTDGGNTVAWFGTPQLEIETIHPPSANPGEVVTYTVRITSSGGPAKEVVLDGQLSPYVAWKLGSFAFLDGSPPSGLSLGAAQYSNDGGSTWNYVPVSGGGGALPGFDGKVTHWRMPMTGEMPAGSNFTLEYEVRVK